MASTSGRFFSLHHAFLVDRLGYQNFAEKVLQQMKLVDFAEVNDG